MLPDIFKFQNYKEYVEAWLESRPKKGHGELKKMAQHLRVSTTMMSQVFRGEKELNLEMAVEIAEYLSLSEEETEYFLLLVELNRAGSFKLKNKLKSQVEKKQESAKKVGNRLGKASILNDEARSLFYSNWIYSAIRILSDLDQMKTPSDIAAHLQISPAMVERAVDFLLKNNLCKTQDGLLKMGPAKTFLDPNSPYVHLHHQNWRLLAIQKMKTSQATGFHLTSPMSLSVDDAEKIKAELVQFTSSILKSIDTSPAENARCLNIDWFQI